MSTTYCPKYTLLLTGFATMIALLLLTDCGTTTPGRSTQNSSASLAVAYTSLTALKHGSDVAVIGTISSIVDQHTSGCFLAEMGTTLTLLLHNGPIAGPHSVARPVRWHGCERC